MYALHIIYHIVSHCIVLYFIVLYCIVSYYVILYHIISYYMHYIKYSLNMFMHHTLHIYHFICITTNILFIKYFVHYREYTIYIWWWLLLRRLWTMDMCLCVCESNYIYCIWYDICIYEMVFLYLHFCVAWWWLLIPSSISQELVMNTYKSYTVYIYINIYTYLHRE